MIFLYIYSRYTKPGKRQVYKTIVSAKIQLKKLSLTLAKKNLSSKKITINLPKSVIFFCKVSKKSVKSQENSLFYQDRVKCGLHFTQAPKI